MKSAGLMPYLGMSVGIHAVVLTAAGLAWFSADAFRTSGSGSSGPVVLMSVGDPVPAASAAPEAAPAPVQPAAERPRQLEKAEVAVFRREPEPGSQEQVARHDVADPAPRQSLLNPRGESGDSRVVDGGMEPYLSHIRRKIEACKKYPVLAWRSGEEGEMIFSAAIDAEGKISRLELVSSHGTERLAQAGRQAIENAAPFDRPPAAYGQGLTVRIPIRFTLSQL